MGCLMCKLESEKRGARGAVVRFTWKEWAGIFSAMVLAAAGPAALVQLHASQDHASTPQILSEVSAHLENELEHERELWREALRHERELFHAELERHGERWDEVRRRLEALEGR